ncbi:hypothetical protein RCL1_000242 [Eukaryota sp. TZLM3-RCL]
MLSPVLEPSIKKVRHEHIIEPNSNHHSCSLNEDNLVITSLSRLADVLSRRTTSPLKQPLLSSPMVSSRTSPSVSSISPPALSLRTESIPALPSSSLRIRRSCRNKSRSLSISSNESLHTPKESPSHSPNPNLDSITTPILRAVTKLRDSKDCSHDRHVKKVLAPTNNTITKQSKQTTKANLFQEFLPPNWFFFSISELVLSCLRFYDEPLDLSFVYQAVQNVSVVKKSDQTIVLCYQLTTCWRHLIEKALISHHTLVSQQGDLYSLNSRGMSAFTCVGTNKGTAEGRAFERMDIRGRNFKDLYRNLPPDFEYLTAHELID